MTTVANNLHSGAQKHNMLGEIRQNYILASGRYSKLFWDGHASCYKQWSIDK